MPIKTVSITQTIVKNIMQLEEDKNWKMKAKENKTIMCLMWSLYEVINCTACLHVSVTNDLHIYINSTRVCTNFR